MSDQSDCLVDGLTEAENDSGATIVWAGGTYPCAGGAEGGGKIFDIGGFKLKAGVPIVVRNSVFSGGAIPQEKQTLTYFSAPGVKGRALRINSVTPWQGVILVLDCNDPNQAA